MASKRFKQLPEKTKDLASESIEKLLVAVKKNCTTKFDESIDLSFQINNKQKKGEVNIRTVVNLPGGNGKKIKLAVVCEDSKSQEAKDAGADVVGSDELIEKMDGIDKIETKITINEFNNSVDLNTSFDPTILDGKSTNGIEIKKSNWAQKIDKGPFKAFPVTGGITFTYGGLKVDKNGSVLDTKDVPINGLYACGELVGGVFFNGYPGGSGLTSGAVFGRMAGYGSLKEG